MKPKCPTCGQEIAPPVPMPDRMDHAQIEADRARRSADPSSYIEEIRESLRRRFGDETAAKVGAE